jgi:uncharacterized protein (DUF362 family)
MKKHNGMSRREFLSWTAGVGVAATCPSVLTGCGGSSSAPLPRNESGRYEHRVSSAWIPRGEQANSYGLFKAAVEAATDFSWLAGGDKVFLKLSLNSGNPYPATTDPWALECMVRLLRERGAGEIVAGDQSGVEHVFHTPDGGRGSSRECCRTAGLLAVMDEYQVTPCFFEERGYDAYRATVPSGSHHWTEPIQITTAMDEMDHIIHLPRVANHFLAGKTFGIKVAIGFLRDDSRMFFHMNFGRFQEMYEEINHVPEIESKLRLTVTSGTAVMTTAGPDQGTVVWPGHGLVFASEDLLAHDLLAAAWLEANRMGEDPVDIYSHPAIGNWLARIGGVPEGIEWSRINENPDPSITAFMQNLLNVEHARS